MNYKWLTLIALVFTTPLSALADQSATTSPGFLNGRVEQSTENFRLPRGDADTLRSTFSAAPTQAQTQVPDTKPLQGSTFYANQQPGQPGFGSSDPGMIHSMKHWLRGNAMQGMMGGNASMGMMNGNASMGMMHGHGHDTSNYGNKSPIWHNTPIGGYCDYTGKVPGIVPGNQLYRYGGWFGDGLTPVPPYPLQQDARGVVDWMHLSNQQPY